MSDETKLSAGSRTLPPWAKRVTVLFIWLAMLVLFLWFFNAVSTVILGVLAATIVSATLSPLLRYLPGPRGVAAGLLGLVLIATASALLFALSWPLATPVRNEIARWPDTQVRINLMLTRASADLRLKEPLTVDAMLTALGSFLAGEGGRSLFSRSADVSLGVLLWLVFIFVGSIFLLAEPPERLLSPATMLVPRRQRQQLWAMIHALGPQLRRWVIGTLISMTIVFIASLVGYAVIGLQFAVPLALLAALCEVVPTVGPATAAVVAAIFAAADHGGTKVAGVMIVYGVIQSIEAYIILPMIMRGAVKIHPAVTLFSVVLWGKIFGVPGLMLAIPINLTLWAIAEHFVIDRSIEDENPAKTAVIVTREERLAG